MDLFLPRAAASCGENPGSVCDWVYDRTGNGVLAGIADWFIGRPLTIVAILGVAWVVTRISRRFVRRMMRRVAESQVPPAIAVLTPRQRGSTSPAPGASDAEPAPASPTGEPIVQEPRRVARAESINGVVSSTISVLVWGIAIVMVIGQLGVDLAPLIAGAGIAGIAIGFGAQSLVRDCLAGLFMVVEDQYGIGDIVDLGAATGVVERLTLRVTVVRGEDGTLWHVPNGEVRRVGNLSQLWSVALVDIVVPDDRPLDQAKSTVLAAATTICAEPQFAPTVLEAPQLLGVEQVDADNVTLRLLVKTAPGKQFALQRALREGIKRRLDESGNRPPPTPGTTWSEVAGTPPAGPPPAP